MKLSKLLAVLLAVLMLVSVFAACTSGGDGDPTEDADASKGPDEGQEGNEETEGEEPEEEIEVSDLTLSEDKATITHWTGYSGSDRPVMEAIFEDFNTTDEIGQILPSIMTWEIMNQKLATAYASDTGPDSYCSNARSAWYQGAGCDLSAAYDDGRLSMDIYPTALKDDIAWDGGIWASPMCVFGVTLYYDVDMLTEAGITGAPESMDQLVDWGRQLTIYADDGTVERYGLAIGYDLMWTSFLWNAGDYDVLDIEQDGKCTINAPGIAELFEEVSGYVRDEQISPIILDNGNMMINDKLAMYTNGPWDTPLLTDAGVNFDVANLPGASSGHSNNYVPLKWLLEGDERKFDAFINFSAHWLEEENQIAWCTGSGYPLLRTDMDVSVLGDSWAAKFTDAKDTRRLKSYSMVPGISNVDGDSGILAMLWQRACYGEITDYQAALDEAAMQIDQEVQMVDFKYNG